MNTALQQGPSMISTLCGKSRGHLSLIHGDVTTSIPYNFPDNVNNFYRKTVTMLTEDCLRIVRLENKHMMAGSRSDCVAFNSLSGIACVHTSVLKPVQLTCLPALRCNTGYICQFPPAYTCVVTEVWSTVSSYVAPIV
jgi:hypothetical protein